MGRALVASQIFEPPYATRGGLLDVEPVLFEMAPVREPAGASGGQVYSAQLRADLRFSDGSGLTTAEAAAMLRRSRYLSGLATVDVRDDRIFFELERPNARFDLALTMLDCAVVRDSAEGLLGTGPYALAAPFTRDEIRLTRNVHYHHPPPIEEIVFRIYPPEPDGTPKKKFEQHLKAIESEAKSADGG